MMFNVLCSYVLFNVLAGRTTVAGYFQGMNYFVGILLFHMREEEAFWSFVQMMRIHRFEEIFAEGLPYMMHLKQLLEKKLDFTIPMLYQHLITHSISLDSFLNKIFLSMFASFPSMSLSTIFHLYDILFCDGWGAILQVTLATLELSCDRLLKLNDSGEVLTFLTQITSHVDLRDSIQLASKQILAGQRFFSENELNMPTQNK